MRPRTKTPDLKNVEVNGPGAYKPDHSPTKKKQPSFGMGTSKRSVVRTTNIFTPGPGN